MKKKILIITPGFPHSETDSTCVPYLQDYLLALKQRCGAENIKVIAVQYPFTKTPYRWNDIEVFPSGGENKKSYHYYFTLRRTMKTISQLMKKEMYVIHAFWLGEAAFIGNRAANKYFSHLIITLMGQDVRTGKRILNYLNKDITWFVALSENQDEIFFQTNGIHADAKIPFPIPQIKMDFENNFRKTDVLFVGSFIPVKQPLEFIDIISSLKKKLPELRVKMIGSGNLLEEMQSKITKEDLTNTIQIVGALERQEVFRVMHDAKLLIHTSAFEGQCLVYREALANGMYILSRQVGRIEDTTKHQICVSAEEIGEKAYKLLTSDLNFTPEIFNDAKEITDRYLTLYFPE